MKKLCRILTIAFATLCAANILAGLAPVTLGSMGWLNAIRQTTGTAQNWSMFHSIPRVQRLHVGVIAMDREGNQHEFGTGLPGLKNIHPHEQIRYYYTFERLFTTGGEAYRKPYIDAIAKALKKNNPHLVEFSIHLRIATTHPKNTPQKISFLLERIRKNGKPAVEQRSVFGPFPVNNDGTG